MKCAACTTAPNFRLRGVRRCNSGGHTHATQGRGLQHPFRLKGVDRDLPPGDYEVVTDDELIEGLSFPVYRRVSTAIIVPAQSHQASSAEMVAIDPRDLQSAKDRDTAWEQLKETSKRQVVGFRQGCSEPGTDGS
jgi:hypothetical protein